jgi:hypothetical protein
MTALRARHPSPAKWGTTQNHPLQTLGLVLGKVGFGGKGSHLNADRRFNETDFRRLYAVNPIIT